MARKKNKPLPPLEWLQPRVRLTRVLSSLSLLALALVLMLWNQFFADLNGARPWVISGVQLLPLLLVAPGVLLGSAQGHIWACFMVNLYFVMGILALIDPSQVWFGVLVTLLSVVLFMSGMFYSRWRYQYQRVLAGENSAIKDAGADA
jgi:uncharacterized membrane protein